ncbi:Oidioi.mRNA.OKI2018_I69.XSR.g13360.t1.cds [Oikopleura dioica]|uniref:Oidioi.mRNA.OKI2018_I69.XSR.g13360.t1.cds n=1 Tax=Oikopleura dioica TaxID=34765 RepID=A0ABN7SAC8_OIKDI|nr:Oidioi.mRNA.OKI2018_I69.XSR.g13360.t1.cds [Oikopleura dioica]
MTENENAQEEDVSDTVPPRRNCCVIITETAAFRRSQTWWLQWRSYISKFILWGGIVGICIGYGFLWDKCAAPSTGSAHKECWTTPYTAECFPCGVWIARWLGLLFLLTLIFCYMFYSVIKSCNCLLYGCWPFIPVTPTPEIEARASNNQIYPMEEEWQNPSHWGLDLPSYDDALEMPKVDEDTFDASRGGVENRAYDQSSLGPPPEYEAPEPSAPPIYQTNEETADSSGSWNT